MRKKLDLAVKEELNDPIIEKTEEVTVINETEGNYFLKEKTNLKFIHSGCVVFDCILGGGWPLGRVVNIVGDRSTGKTLLAIEACANFIHEYPEGLIIYIEAEAAFDEEYAAALGMPTDRVVFVRDIDTVEGLFDKIQEVCAEAKDIPILCIIDSLDALSDKEEKERKIEEGSYGTNKAKKMSELFRRSIKDIENSNMCLMVISQTRQKIGVLFGKKKGRSGGDALDFYASIIVWLSELSKIEKTVSGIKRKIGINVKAECVKNKISLPYRSCEFPIILMYGVDDILASLEWLNEAKTLDVLGISKTEIKKTADELKLSKDTELINTINELVKTKWYEIEQSFAPKGKKYVA